MTQSTYCQDSFNYRRRPAREVRVGKLVMGGEHPIRVQSMTTTDTLNVEETVAQSIRMIDAGCELVRITAPSKKEAESLKDISDQLKAAGHTLSLIHI